MTREEIEKHIDDYVNEGVALPYFLENCYDEVYGSLLPSNPAYSPNCIQYLIDVALIKSSPLYQSMMELDNED